MKIRGKFDRKGNLPSRFGNAVIVPLFNLAKGAPEFCVNGDLCALTKCQRRRKSNAEFIGPRGNFDRINRLSIDQRTKQSANIDA